MGCLSSGHGKKRNRQKKHNRQYCKMAGARKLEHDDQTFKHLTTQKLADKLKNQEIDYDVAGLAQNFCLACNRHFNTQQVMEEHVRSKKHKQQVKKMKKDKPFSHEEMYAASGMGSYVKPEVTENEKTLIEKNQTNLKGKTEGVQEKME